MAIVSETRVAVFQWLTEASWLGLAVVERNDVAPEPIEISVRVPGMKVVSSDPPRNEDLNRRDAMQLDGDKEIIFVVGESGLRTQIPTTSRQVWAISACPATVGCTPSAAQYAGGT